MCKTGQNIANKLKYMYHSFRGKDRERGSKRERDREWNVEDREKESDWDRERVKG